MKVENGQYDKLDNPLKNAPHTLAQVTSDKWSHKYPSLFTRRYTREEAAFPLPYIAQRGKFWPSVRRIQGAYGDRNLITSIPLKSAYLQWFPKNIFIIFAPLDRSFCPCLRTQLSFLPSAVSALCSKPTESYRKAHGSWDGSSPPSPWLWLSWCLDCAFWG